MHVYERQTYSSTQANTVFKDGLTDRLDGLKEQTVVKQGGFIYPTHLMSSMIKLPVESMGLLQRNYFYGFPKHFWITQCCSSCGQEWPRWQRRKLLLKHTNNGCQHSTYVLLSFHISHFPLTAFALNFLFPSPGH